VKTGKDEHLIADHPVDEAVWEPAEDRPAPVAMDDWKGKRILRQPVNERLCGPKEIIA